MASVISGSAGETAGLLANDIIVEFDNVKVTDLMQYSNLLKKYQPGEIVNIKVLRGDKEKEISLKLGER